MNRTKCADGVRAALFSLVVAAVAHAATFTWDGGGTTTAWSDDFNWVGNVQPANNGTADIVFGPTNKGTTVVNQDWNINSLVFDEGAPNIHFIDDASTTLTIQGSTFFGIGLASLENSIHSIENPIVLGNSQIWTIAEGIMGFEGGIVLGNHTLSMNVGGDAVFLIGPISGSQAGGLVKTGIGVLQMSGGEPNTYTGTTTVNQGTLTLGKNIFAAPALLGPLVIGDGTGGPDADKVVLAVTSQLDGDVKINSSGLLDLNGVSEVISDLTLAGGHVQTGAGTLTVSSQLTHEASTQSSIINGSAGTVSLGTTSGSTNVNVADGIAANDLVINGEITGPASRSFIKTGTGQLVLTGSHNTYLGRTFVFGGTLVLQKSGAILDGGILGDLDIGTIGSETAIVRLALNSQIVAASGNEVTIGELGILDTGGWFDSIGPLVMRGGRVTGGGSLSVGFGVRSETSAQIAIISSALNLNGSVQNFDIAGGSAHPDLEIAGDIFNGGINKTGIGTLVLRGFNTYTGPTTVNGGLLLVNNTSGSGTGSGSVAVNSSLGGDGSIAGGVSVAGTLAPGSSIGDLAVGAVAFGSGARFLIELGGLNAGTEFDQLIVAGDALLNGLLNVPLVGGFVPAQGDMFEILKAGNVTGQFSLLGLPAVASGTGLTWQVHYNPGDVTLEVLTALLGDYNGNGVVDAPDYVVWRNTLGQSPPGLAADGDGDGVIDADDYNIWKAHFGQSSGSAGASVNGAVPEPATWILIILAAGVSGKRWQHRKVPATHQRVTLVNNPPF